jgi:hypothetical protein
MAMANRSMTKAVGAEFRTAGRVADSVNLHGAGMRFDREHSAEFMFRCHRTWVFYGLLLEKLGYTPTP